jgi:two-component system KDP operon response regulator KdpE
MTRTARILLVDDEVSIQRAMTPLLRSRGYETVVAATARDALGAMETDRPDLVILDLGLPDGDGADFIRDFRGWSTVPVIVLSARVDETDKIEALDLGADDYLTKPFGIGELMARVRATLRRRTGATTDATAVIHFGDVDVDPTNRVVKKGGVDLHLTPIEYRLLMLLLANPGKVLTHRHLLREVWGPSYIESSHYVRIYVGHLRQKLEADPAQPRHLLTETGVGYRFQL